MKTELVKEEETQNRPNQWKKKKKKKPRSDQTSERRRKKKEKRRRNPKQTELVKEEEEGKKKKEPNSQPRRRKEKKSQKVIKRCSRVLFVGSLYVFNYNIAIELWVIETENRQNVFSVSITHNSKIRELSDRNRVMDFPNKLFVMVPPFLSYELWKLRYKLWKLLNLTPPKIPFREEIF